MLLPSRFQPEALPTPGPAIRKPEPVKADPIREFERGDHQNRPGRRIVVKPIQITDEGVKTVTGITVTGISPPNFSLDLGSGEVKVEEPKFRVGDRFRLAQKYADLFLQKEFVAERVTEDEQGTQVWGQIDCQEGFFYTDKLELIPSPPTSDGWNGELVVGKVYLTSSRDWLTPMFARWTQMGWAAASFRASSAMDNRALTNHPDGREVLREATEAELRGES